MSKKEKKRIDLNPESVKDKEIIDNKRHLDGTKYTIRDLAVVRGTLEHELWTDIKEKYPEVNEGIWQLRYEDQEWFIEQTVKPNKE